MANYLKMTKRQQVIALLELGWTYRRIEAETGVRRETISRYDRWRRSNAAKAFPGSRLPARSTGAPYRDAIQEKLDQDLSLQRIWQDLVEEFGYGGSYESIKRYARRLDRPRRAVGVYHSAAGEEAQVDFFRGGPTWRAERGQWQRPWVFRMTLCCSRHGYEEAVWDQKLETFLRLHENAFNDFGGVVGVVRHDNLKAAVVHACFFDPDANDIYTAFAQHWGFTALPTRPKTPQENGKQERSGGYVKDNAIKGRRYDSLDDHNAHLRRWNRTIARLRIHGTTRKQVWTHFLETDRKALRPLPAEPFLLFESGTRRVHVDGHIEVRGSFYPVAHHLLNQTVRVRWDRHLVRIFHEDALVAVHRRISPGLYAPRPGGEPLEITSTQRALQEQLLGRCARIGAPLRLWAEQAVAERGVRAYRLIQGVLRLTRTHPRERVLHAAQRATAHRLFRYRDLKRLTEVAPLPRTDLALTHEHESIRPMTAYRLEDLE